MDRLLAGVINHVSFDDGPWAELLARLPAEASRYILKAEAAALVKDYCPAGCEWVVFTRHGHFPSGEMLHMLECADDSIPGFFSLRQHACDSAETLAFEFGVTSPEIPGDSPEVTALCLSARLVGKSRKKQLRLQPTVEVVWRITDDLSQRAPWQIIVDHLQGGLLHAEKRCAVICTEALAGRLESLGFLTLVPEEGLTSLTMLPMQLTQLCFCRPVTIDMCAALLHLLSTKPELELELAGFFYDFTAWPENCFVISTLIHTPVQVDSLGFWTNLQTRTAFARQRPLAALEPLVFGESLSSRPTGAGIVIIGEARDHFERLIAVLLGLRMKCPEETMLLIDVASECEQVLLACVRMNIRYRNVQHPGAQASVAAAFFHACSTLESGEWTVISLADPASLEMAGLLSGPAQADTIRTVDPQAGTMKILAMVVGLVAAGAVDSAKVTEIFRTKTVASCVFRTSITPELTSTWLKLLGDALIIGNQGIELASAIVSTAACILGQAITIAAPEALPALSFQAMVRRFRPSLTPGAEQLPVLALLGQSTSQIASRISAWNWSQDTNMVLLIEQSRVRLAKQLISEWAPGSASIVGIMGKKRKKHRVKLDLLTQGRSSASMVCIIDSQLEPSPGAMLNMKMPRPDCSGFLPRGCGPIFLRISCQSDLVFEADGSISQVNIADGRFDHYDAGKLGWQEAQA